LKYKLLQISASSLKLIGDLLETIEEFFTLLEKLPRAKVSHLFCLFQFYLVYSPVFFSSFLFQMCTLVTINDFPTSTLYKPSIELQPNTTPPTTTTTTTPVAAPPPSATLK
jgi:hypothetical protein